MARLIQLFVALILAFPFHSAVAAYPDKPIKLVIGYPPGGTTDIVGRLLSQRLSAMLGQPVVVENRAGANGNVGNVFVSSAPADGYTLSLSTGSSLTINGYLMPAVPDPLRDLTPIGLAVGSQMALVAHPSVAAMTVPELVALLKAKPGQLNHSSAGTGSPNHLFMELFKNKVGVNIVHIPHKGAAEAMNSLVAGHVQLTFDTLAVVMPYVDPGRLRILAVTGSTRHPKAPGAPTLIEAGVAGFEQMTSWYALVGPPGMPKDIFERLNAALRQILQEPEMNQKLVAMGLTVLGGSSERMRSHISEERETWRQIVQGIGPELKR